MTNVEILEKEYITTKALPRSPKLQVTALLVLVTLIWGSTFLVVQNALKLVGPFTFLGIRFSIGALVLILIFHKRLLKITRKELLTGLTIGLFLFAAYALQTIGLQYTTTSKAGFLTAMYVPLVAILAVPLLKQRLAASGVVGVILSVVGLALISLNNQLQFSIGLGETLVLGCALASALHIISISKFAPNADAINLAIIQIAVTAVLSFIAMPLAREPFVMPSPPVWEAALFLGVLATAFCLAVMNRVQQFVSSTQATLIYALEPVWVLLLGAIVGEQLSMFAWIGCTSIFLGIIISEVRFALLKKLFKKA